MTKITESLLEQQLQESIEKNTTQTKIHSLYAKSLFADGKIRDALEYLDKTQLASKDAEPQVHVDLGEMLLNNGHFERATRHFNAAIKRAPKSDQLWHILGIAQYRAGHKAEARKSFARSEKYDRFRHQIQIAERAMESADSQTFDNTLSQILQSMPSHTRAVWLKASWFMQQGQIEQAAAILPQALNYAPYHEALLQLMVLVQVQLCDLASALKTTSRLLDVAPDNHEYWMLKADIEQNSGSLNESLKSFEKAIVLGSDKDETYLQMAYQLQSMGENEKAIAHFRRCINSNECIGSAFWGLSTFSQFRLKEEEKLKLKALQWDTSLSPEQACQISFSLARNAEKQGQYEEAFCHYENANNLKSGTRYSPIKMENKFAAIKHTFNSSFLSISNSVKPEPQQATPIFITGLPRTGSTLIEQILSSHSQVEATMELKTMPAVARRAWLMSCEKTGEQEGNLKCLSQAELNGLGQYYLQLSEVYRNNSDSQYFIDKLPPNYQHIGLIHKILPNAIIIDTRRAPMAWGMAVYRQYFSQGHDFSYDFNHIAHAYNKYLSLMHHWNDTIPGKVSTVKYENLIADKETQIKAMLQHCCLRFEEQCLAPHEYKRYVKTASSDQVNKPIYTNAVNSWKHYESYLGELKEAFSEYDLL